MSNDSFTSKDNFKKGTIVEDVKERLMWVVANEPCEFNGRFYVPVGVDYLFNIWYYPIEELRVVLQVADTIEELNRDYRFTYGFADNGFPNLNFYEILCDLFDYVCDVTYDSGKTVYGKPFFDFYDGLEGSSFKLEVIYEVVRGLSNHTISFSDSFSLDIDYAKVILYKSSRPLYNDEKHILDEISHYGSQENMDNYFLNRKDYDEQEIVKLL